MAAVFLDLLATWTPERAWWWGAFLGDGNCYVKDGTYRISLVGAPSTAACWHKLICPEEATGPRKLKNTDKAVEAVVYSRELAGRLRELGVYGPKTFNLPWPEDLPDTLLPHFLRGLWDTDGSISLPPSRVATGRRGGVVSYTSSCLPFVERVRDTLATVAGRRAPVVGNRRDAFRWHTVQFAGSTALAVVRYLYTDAPEHLRNEERWQRFQEFDAYFRAKEVPCACGAPNFTQGKCYACFWAERPKITGKGTQCAEEGCTKTVDYAGRCSACYTRKRRAEGLAPRKSSGPCACGKPAYRRGLCDACYSRQRRAQR